MFLLISVAFLFHHALVNVSITSSPYVHILKGVNWRNYNMTQSSYTHFCGQEDSWSQVVNMVILFIRLGIGYDGK